MLAAFDLDNTLVDRSSALQRWAELLIRREGMPAEAARAIVDADRAGTMPRDEFLKIVQSLPGMRMTIAELRDWYAISYTSCYRIESESIQALTMLRNARWKIGVVTNGSVARTVEKLAHSGLAPLIDALCVAEEIGICKPDRRIFEEMARRCGVELTGWMIGDAPVEDVGGGAQAGLRTVWLRRGRRWDGKATPPDIEAESVLEATVAILSSAKRVTTP
jgi:putative hydrolase of the HAD superfamily